MVEYSRLDNQIHFDSTTQRDIVTSQLEGFLLVQCLDEALFSAEIKTKADDRAEFLVYKGGELLQEKGSLWIQMDMLDWCLLERGVYWIVGVD